MKPDPFVHQIGDLVRILPNGHVAVVTAREVELVAGVQQHRYCCTFWTSEGPATHTFRQSEIASPSPAPKSTWPEIAPVFQEGDLVMHKAQMANAKYKTDVAPMVVAVTIISECYGGIVVAYGCRYNWNGNMNPNLIRFMEAELLPYSQCDLPSKKPSVDEIMQAIREAYQ